MKLHEDRQVLGTDGEMANGSVSLEFKVLTGVARKRRALYGPPRSWVLTLGSC